MTDTIHTHHITEHHAIQGTQAEIDAKLGGRVTIADLIENLHHIELITATGGGLSPEDTIRVHTLAGIGRALTDDAAWFERAPT